MTDPNTSEDAISVGSSAVPPFPYESEIQTQIQNLVERFEKDHSTLNHLRKTVRSLRGDRTSNVEGPPSSRHRSSTATSNANANANANGESTSEKYVEKSYFKKKMKGISSKLTELAETKDHQSEGLQNSLNEIKEQMEEHQTKLVKFDDIVKKVDNNNKIISQCNSRIDELKTKSQKAFKQTEKDVIAVGQKFEDFRNNEFAQIKVQMDQLKEEIHNANILKKTGSISIMPSLGKISSQSSNSNIGSNPNLSGNDFDFFKANQQKLMEDIHNIKEKIAKLEEMEITNTRLDEIQNNLKSAERAISENSDRLKDMEEQHKLDNEQHREDEIQLQTQFKGVLLSVEDAETEMTAQIEESKKEYSNFTSSFLSKFEEMKEESTSSITKFNEQSGEYIEKLDSKFTEISELMEKYKTETIEKSAQNEGEIEKLSSAMKKLKKSVTKKFKESMNELNSYKEKESEIIESLKTSDTEIIERIEKLQTDISAQIENESKQEEIDKEIQKLTEKEESLESKINELEESNGEKEKETKEKIKKLKEKIENAVKSSESSTTESSQKAIEQAITQLKENELKDISNKQDSLENKVDNADKILNEEFKAKLTELEGNVGTTTDTNSLLEKKIKEIEEKIDQIVNGSIHISNEGTNVNSSEIQSRAIDIESEGKLESMEQSIKEFNERLNEVNDLINEIQQLNADALTDTIQLIKTSQDDNTNNIDGISIKLNEIVENLNAATDKSNETATELADFKGKLLDNFVSMNVLDSLKQKHKNLKEALKIGLTELNAQLEADRNVKNDQKEEVNKYINEIKSSIQEFISSEEESKMVIREQLKKINKQIAYLKAASNLSGDGVMDENTALAAEFSIDLDEIKAKINTVESMIANSREEIVTINGNIHILDTTAKEQKHDYLDRISNLEYISAKEREEFMKLISQIEEKVDSTVKELSDCPRMVTAAVESNQVAINDFSQRVEGALTDMRSQLQQASFADDEIEEIKERIKVFEESSKHGNSDFTERIASIESILEKRKKAEDEHSKIWAAVNDLKVSVEVQQNTTNPHFSQIISNISKQLHIGQKGSDESESESENDKEKDEGEQIVLFPDIRADIEMLKTKLASLEENTRDQKDITTHIKEDLVENQEKSQRITETLRQETKEMRESLPKYFVEVEIFESFKNEFNILQGFVNTSAESSVEGISALNEKFSTYSQEIEDIKQSIIVNAQNSDNNGDDSSKPVAESQIGGEAQAAISSTEINDLKLLINGVDIAAQRQIRQLKTSVRKIERALEDAEDEEKRQDELLKLQKEREERERIKKRLLQEEEEEDTDDETPEDDSEENNNNENKDQVQEQPKDKEVAVVADGNNNANENNSNNNNNINNGVNVNVAKVNIVNVTNNNLVTTSNAAETEIIIKPEMTIRPRRQLFAYLTPDVVRLPTSIELIQDDFQIFFVLMFVILLYFLVSDIFIS